MTTPYHTDATPRIDDAAATLALAFQGTSVFEHTQPSARRQATALPGVFAALVRGWQRRGEVISVDDSAAIAAWGPGQRHGMSAIDVLRDGLLLAVLRLGPTAAIRLQRHEAPVNRVLQRLATPQTAYLALMAVRPDAQGTGAGRRIIDAALDAMRRAGFERCLLVTDDEPNVGFYRHLGFHVIALLEDRRTGPPTWVMERPLSTSPLRDGVREPRMPS